MNRNALIIFVRNPVMGKVKTRIAAVLGKQEALRIYRELLHHTHDISTNIDADKYVFYSDHLEPGDLWEDDRYQKYLQQGDTLGEKMNDAFTRLYDKGHEKVVVIGSDCFELTTGILANAFDVLGDNDAVAGPARDGGYYLLGMKKMIPQVFNEKKWSTGSVYAATLADFERAGIRYFVLPVLHDLDTAEDVRRWTISQKKTSG